MGERFSELIPVSAAWSDLEYFYSPLDGMLVHRRVTYTWAERGTVRVKCLAQEHNTMSLVRARTQTTRSGEKRANHEATAPPSLILSYYAKRLAEKIRAILLSNQNQSWINRQLPVFAAPWIASAIGRVRYINILTWLRGFQVKLLYLVMFSLYPSLSWELRDKTNLINLHFWPESLGAMLECWYIERGLLWLVRDLSFVLVLRHSAEDCSNEQTLA